MYKYLKHSNKHKKMSYILIIPMKELHVKKSKLRK